LPSGVLANPSRIAVMLFVASFSEICLLII
jgi:hypothetical protein